MVREIWLSKKNNNKKKNNNNREEEEYSDLPACRISETVSSLVLKLGLHIVVGSSRLDNHLAFVRSKWGNWNFTFVLVYRRRARPSESSLHRECYRTL